VDIIFKGRHTEVQERFRRYASAKLSKLEKLDHKAIRVDVEVSAERNPRQSDRRERVELTIHSRGPVIRAEAASDDRVAAFDRALAKLEERLRRTCDRRKSARHGPAQAGRVPGLGRIPGMRTPALDDGLTGGSGVAQNGQRGRAGRRGAEPGRADAGPGQGDAEPGRGDAEPGRGGAGPERGGAGPEREWMDGRAGPERDGAPASPAEEAGVVPIQMEGDGPVVVREKHHHAAPMSVDQALLEMELVGHDFYLFRDEQCGLPSVVYRRHGYQYGLIRLMERERAVAGAGRGTGD
jgi:ribosomal subunit interface protein